MNKSDLLVLKSIISERYIEEPKSAKKTEKGYIKDVIEKTFQSMETESETAPTVFNDALGSIKTDPVHSGGFFKELLLDATEKYVSVVSPFISPEPKNEEDSDEAILKRLGLTKEMLSSLDSDSIEKLLKPHRKSKSSKYLKSEIAEMEEEHYSKVAPLLFPEKLEFYPKDANIKNNRPETSRGWHWYSGIKYQIAENWLDVLIEAELIGMFNFTEKDISDVREKAESERQLHYKNVATAEGSAKTKNVENK